METKKMKRKTILLGEGVNQHTLYGEFKTEQEVGEFLDVEVLVPSELKHETPSRQFAEHHTLSMDSGKWQQGKQVEYNPFEQRITAVWD
jgi:hypothetical protein